VICAPVYAVHPDAVGIWLFDEGQGDEAEDSSGNGHTAKVGAGSGELEWDQGKIGKAVGFKPGTYLEVAHTDMLNLETFTVESKGGTVTDLSAEGVKTLALQFGISTGAVDIEFLDDARTEALFTCTATNMQTGQTATVKIL